MADHEPVVSKNTNDLNARVSRCVSDRRVKVQWELLSRRKARGSLRGWNERSNEVAWYNEKLSSGRLGTLKHKCLLQPPKRSSRPSASAAVMRPYRQLSEILHDRVSAISNIMVEPPKLGEGFQ